MRLSRGAQLHHFPTKSSLVAAALDHLARSATLHLLQGMAFDMALGTTPARDRKRNNDAVLSL